MLFYLERSLSSLQLILGLDMML